MKKFFLVTLLFGVWALVYSQDSDTLSLAESFSSRAGSVVERQFYDVGKIKGLTVQVVKYKDLVTEKSLSSLRFEYTDVKTYTSSTKISVLDSDELDGAIKALTAILQSVYYAKREVYTEITYRSRGRFECGAFFDLKKDDWVSFVSLGRPSHTLVFTKEEMSKVLAFLELGKQKM
jgi:hypothetical protein